MRKEQFFKTSVLISIAVFTIGCTKDEEPTPIKQPTVVNKPVKIVPQKPSGVTLSQLSSGGVKTLTLNGSTNYESGDPIQFEIDTNNMEGYIYVIYSDSTGKVGILYPNSIAPLSEMSGKKQFPQDFGNMPIKATKDCQGCEKDKTVVYAFLTKEPILDIKSIDKEKLLNIVGNAQKSKPAKPTKDATQKKGIDMTLNEGGASGKNIDVGVLEFFVE